MEFLIVMLLCDCLIPLLVIGMGLLMYKCCPTRIGGSFGYRTKRSMRNMDTWRFAHNYVGKLWVNAGLVMLVPTVLAHIPLIYASESTIGWAALGIEMMQVIVLFWTIYMTERALKKAFDEKGNRR